MNAYPPEAPPRSHYKPIYQPLTSSPNSNNADSNKVSFLNHVARSRQTVNNMRRRRSTMVIPCSAKNNEYPWWLPLGL